MDANQMNRRTRLKVCCIADANEAKLAVRYGADVLGLVGPMPSGPGVISDELTGRLVRSAPPAVSCWLLTSETDPEAIVAHQRRTGANTLQLVDGLQPETYAHLRAYLPGVKLVQVLHVVDGSAVEEALSVQDAVDAVLLDSGNPNLTVKELGGTGRTHDWAISRQIRERVNVPVFLAGGLRPENVIEAIRAVRPFGLDVCSGIRTGGKLDEEKLARFVSGMATADGR